MSILHNLSDLCQIKLDILFSDLVLSLYKVIITTNRSYLYFDLVIWRAQLHNKIY